MQLTEPPIATVSSVKRFFSAEPLNSGEFHIRGIGIRERMPVGMVERPHGTGDYLIMLFHDAASAGCRAGTETPIKPDTMMIWSPGKAQLYGNRAQFFVHSWIHCEGKRIQNMLRLAKIPILKPFQIRNPSSFQQGLLDVHSELVSYRHADLVIIGNLLENCFREIARKMDGSNEKGLVPEKLLELRRLMATGPSKIITLQEMAKQTGMSLSYFCMQFKDAFGLSPMECLIQHRMHRAALLLFNQNLTISEIAIQVGYNDLFHFSKMFKKQFGIGPREMRNRQLCPAPERTPQKRPKP